jgi:hypothetical protein
MKYIIPGIERIRISLNADNGLTLSDCVWSVVFGVGRKRVTIDKGVVISDNEVDVYLDTSLLAPGRLEAQLNIEFVDSDAPNGIRRKSIDITNPSDYLDNGL